MKKMKIAVTGASGHIGNVLCRELKKLGHEVNALLFEDPDDLDNIGVNTVKGDLLDPVSLENLCKDAEIVFHLAAKISITNKNKNEVFRINVEGTKNLMAACLKQHIGKFIHFSSIHALDPFPLDEELNENRPYVRDITMAYEQSKLESEKLVLEAVKNGLNAVILNPTAIIGPYDFKPSFLGQAIMKMYNNSLPMLVPGGYNWVDVRDVVNGAISAMENGQSGERYILSGHYVGLKELSLMIGKLLDKKTPGFSGPTWLAYLGIPFINLYAHLRKENPLYTSESLKIINNSNRNISHAKATQELGYTARPFEITIKDTFEWYKEVGMVR
ncbi:MAG: NAD-dependent epimerase/dehydratase family protein [Bacteroidales bacterium]|nr:NAD-dependent epimerase/dehydratase family protein [Bacteroidales bacterium]